MKKLIVLALFSVSLLIITGCTEQQKARSYGGTATVDLPVGQKLINVTWKGEDLWYLTKPMKTNDVAETYEFKESSSFGFMNGKVLPIAKRDSEDGS